MKEPNTFSNMKIFFDFILLTIIFSFYFVEYIILMTNNEYYNYFSIHKKTKCRTKQKAPNYYSSVS